MLLSISVQNYALINKLDIDFKQGFSTITGETGAGKSILLGALSLLLGQRADSSVLRDKDRKCVVEGSFDLRNMNLKRLFEHNDIDYEQDTIIRRVINENGKSRAFVNDIPVNLSFLKDLGENLIDIHSQHQTLVLASGEFQLNILDALSAHDDKLNDYKKIFGDFREVNNLLKSLKEKNEKAGDDLDYLKHQFEELDKAKLIPTELNDLEKELSTLSNIDEIKSTLLEISNTFFGEEQSIVSNLKDISKKVLHVSSLHKDLEPFVDRAENIYYDVKDMAEEISRLEEKVEVSPDRLAEVSSRIDLLYSLQQKHRCLSIEELINLRNDYGKKIETIEGYDDEIEGLEKKQEEILKDLKKKAGVISQKRKKVASILEKRVLDLLQQMGMPNASFHVELSEQESYSALGKDTIQFLFSANKNIPPQPLSKIASGGEMSRVMLALKYMLADTGALPTIIFDEIDTGVSGDIADKMGRIMKSLSKNRQVIAITHLPQVAGKGEYHYKVFKEEKESTYSNIKLLSTKDRLNEIAQMLSGKDVTQAALDNATELLKN